jgi:hypothetical protein
LRQREIFEGERQGIGLEEAPAIERREKRRRKEPPRLKGLHLQGSDKCAVGLHFSAHGSSRFLSRNSGYPGFARRVNGDSRRGSAGIFEISKPNRHYRRQVVSRLFHFRLRSH